MPRPKPPEPSLKVGIVLMTRKPHRFDYWLRYHRSLGIALVSNPHVIFLDEPSTGLDPETRQLGAQC